MTLAKFVYKYIIFQSILVICSHYVDSVLHPSTFKKYNEIIGATTKIVKSCHEMRGPTGVAGSSPDSMIAFLESEEPTPIVVLNDLTGSVNDVPVTVTSRYKLHIFVIMVSSTMELERILVMIKSSRWWNHMAIFYMIDWPVNEHGCSRVYETLWTAWRMNILEANFVCTDWNEGQLIYTFNPYTSDAPSPWQLNGTYSGVKDHPWSLFVRKYRNDSGMCENMNFDKTKDLGGYEIRVTVSEIVHTIRRDRETFGLESLGGNRGRIMHNFFRSVNATVILVHHPSNESFDVAKADTTNGISDMSLIYTNLVSDANLTHTYPFYITGLSIMTQYRGHASQLSKIISVLDVKTKIGVSLVAIFTFIFFKYFARQSWATAALNIILMMCNASLTDLPRNPSLRIYLTSLFMFTITIHGIYQGQWASLLSNQKALKDVNTMTDLKKSDHAIYGHHMFADYFNDPKLKKRFVGIENLNCTEYVLRNKSAACVQLSSRLILQAAKAKLHVSSNFIANYHCTHPIREDWPLERRVNMMIRILVTSNIYQYTYKKDQELSLHIIQANNDENKGLKIFNLGDLSFAFAILGIGLICAAIIFSVEIAIGS